MHIKKHFLNGWVDYIKVESGSLGVTVHRYADFFFMGARGVFLLMTHALLIGARMVMRRWSYKNSTLHIGDTIGTIDATVTKSFVA